MTQVIKKLPKKTQKMYEVVSADKTKIYKPEEAFTLLKAAVKAAERKFVESVDIAIRLGVDPKKSDQAVRGATVLPKGTGKSVRVAVIAQGDAADQAKIAGADIVGFDDLAEQIKGGKIDFDVLIATPASMRLVGQLGQILGPRGLMPNPKVGTVSNDVTKAVTNAKSGQVSYRTDKAGILHCKLGNVGFEAADLIANLNALIADVRKARPSSAKGIYLKKITVSSTMGPGVNIDISSLES